MKMFKIRKNRELDEFHYSVESEGGSLFVTCLNRGQNDCCLFSPLALQKSHAHYRSKTQRHMWETMCSHTSG